MKKKDLTKAVEDCKSETASAILTILTAIGAPGQIKKVLKDPAVAELVARYEVPTEGMV